MAEPVETQTVYDTALTFFNSLSKVIVSQPSTHSASNLRAARPNFIIQHPQNHWKKPYVGPSCDVVRDKIREYEGKFSVTGRKYYSKALTPLQSNGTGKSRFANEYGNICSMITHVIRQPDSGFPPSDEAVYYFMRSCPSDQDKENLQSRQLSTDSDEKANYVWFHAMAIGILQATFHHCKLSVPWCWLDESLAIYWLNT